MDGWKEERKDVCMGGQFIHLIGQPKTSYLIPVGFPFSHCRATEGPKYKVFFVFVFVFSREALCSSSPPKPILREAKQEFWAPFDG